MSESGSNSDPMNLLYFAIAAHHHPQLLPRPTRENTAPYCIRIQLIAGEIAVDKLDHLLRGHARIGIALVPPEVLLLLRAPPIDKREVLGVDVYEGIKQVR